MNDLVTVETRSEPIQLRSLHRKLAEVMADAERIPKNGTYTGQGGFKYVLVGDAADAIRTALAARGVSMLPTSMEPIGESEHETRSGGTMTTFSVRVTWTLTDAESGEQAVLQSIGTGADAGDKFTPKAQTNAMKYALLMGFLLSTGDDPETMDSTDRRARQDAPRGPETARDAAEGLIGTIITQGNQDLELRALPSGGFATRFRLKDGRSSFICQATSPLADALVAVRDELIDHRVTLFGKWSDESFRKGKETVRFKLLNVTRVETPDWVLPAPIAEPEFETLEFPDRLPLEEPA